jgi:hypothetical protein
MLMIIVDQSKQQQMCTIQVDAMVFVEEVFPRVLLA